MISSLRGTVRVVSSSSVVIEVGGVGFSVNVTPDYSASLRKDETAVVSTSLIVREDSLTLYGFACETEREVFELLISVSGVGPKSALGVLAALSPDAVGAAVRTEDDAVFRKVSGIGPKTAKLIVLSLAGKLPMLAVGPAISQTPAPQSLTADLLSALVALGWSERVAIQAVDEIADRVPEDASVQDALRVALTHLGPRQASGAR